MTAARPGGRERAAETLGNHLGHITLAPSEAGFQNLFAPVPIAAALVRLHLAAAGEARRRGDLGAAGTHEAEAARCLHQYRLQLAANRGGVHAGPA